MLRKHKIAIALSVFFVLVIIIVVVAVVLSMAIVTISNNHYGLLHKKSEDFKLVENKTYTSGMKWAGFGNTFHQFEIKTYQIPNNFLGTYKNQTKNYIFKVTANCELISEELSDMWYAIYGEPTANTTNLIRDQFENYLNTVETYERVSSTDKTVSDTVKANCCTEFKKLVKEELHLSPTYCMCTHIAA